MEIFNYKKWTWQDMSFIATISGSILVGLAYLIFYYIESDHMIKKLVPMSFIQFDLSQFMFIVLNLLIWLILLLVLLVITTMLVRQLVPKIFWLLESKLSYFPRNKILTINTRVVVGVILIIVRIVPYILIIALSLYFFNFSYKRYSDMSARNDEYYYSSEDGKTNCLVVRKYNDSLICRDMSGPIDVIKENNKNESKYFVLNLKDTKNYSITSHYGRTTYISLRIMDKINSDRNKIGLNTIELLGELSSETGNNSSNFLVGFEESKQEILVKEGLKMIIFKTGRNIDGTAQFLLQDEKAKTLLLSQDIRQFGSYIGRGDRYDNKEIYGIFVFK